VPLVEHGPVIPWFKDRRLVAIAGAGCFIAGFLLALVIFGAPWHLPPDWGDIPTWILAIFAIVAGGVGYGQLRLLKRQVDEDRRLNVKRDELFDRQLAAELRKQAEDVEVTWVPQGGGVIGVVENNSRRPVSSIACKIVSSVDRQVLKLPTESGERSAARTVELFAPDMKPLQVFGLLRPQSGCIFVFANVAREPDQVVVAWFTDDAGFRWQLDEYRHLVPAAEEDEYLP
jgi:hypothetical protein